MKANKQAWSILLLCFCMTVTTVCAFTYVADDGVEYWGGSKYSTDSDYRKAYVYNMQKKSGKTASIKSTVILGSQTCKVIRISERAFQACAVSSVTVPGTINTIEQYAFADCSYLRTISIPEEVKKIARYTFKDCYSLSSIAVPAAVTAIEAGAFSGCMQLSSCTFPDSSRLKSINYYAFKKTALRSITIPDSVTDIGNECFQSCGKLKSISFPARLSNLGTGCFQYCESLVTATFNNKKDVISIKDYVFDGCINLQQIVMPQTLTYIGNYAFRDCKSLLSADIPEGATSLGNCAFQNCQALKSVSIPSTITSIGENAFSGCTSLDTVYAYMWTPCKPEKDAFSNISSKCVLVVPEGRTAQYAAAGWTTGIFMGGIVEMSIPAGISTVKAGSKTKAESWYDLQGRQVTRPEKGRIYIHDGRKVVR